MVETVEHQESGRRRRICIACVAWLFLVLVGGFFWFVPDQKTMEARQAKKSLVPWIYEQPVDAADKATLQALRRIGVECRQDKTLKASVSIHATRILYGMGYSIMWQVDGPGDVFEAGVYNVYFWYGLEIRVNKRRVMS